ncbi:MAG: DUF2470 domain-containing protein [Pseudomonadota bacterium]
MEQKKSAAGPGAYDHAAARDARHLVRNATKAALATRDHNTEHPYVSLVIVATDFEGSPLLLLSSLAAHTKNLRADARASLLFEANNNAQDPTDATPTDPMARNRVTVTGRMIELSDSDASQAKSRFLARHPGSAGYAAFTDFAFYRLDPSVAHFIGGFGRIVDIPAEGLTLPAADCAELRHAESDIVSHMNVDHQDAINLYAATVMGRAASEQGWRMIGIDPEGIDLQSDHATLRIPFEQRLHNAADARRELKNLVENVKTNRID